MEISERTIDGIRVMSISGVAGISAAGRLYDALVAAVGVCDGSLVLDLSGLRHMSRAAVRGVLVAAKLLHSAGRQLRICAADPSVEALLLGLGFAHLVRCDRNLGDSLSALSSGRGDNVIAFHTPVRELRLEEVEDLLRVDYARFLIDQGWRPLDRVAEACGFDGFPAMHRSFLRHLGTSPTHYATKPGLAATGA